MKKQFNPIAMRCNQEQFESIKGTLVEHGLAIISMSWFNRQTYLVNNYGNTDGCVSNINYAHADSYGRQVFKEWNADIFLESCGIETKTETKTENKMKTVITAQELLEIHKIACDGWKAKIKTNYFSRITLDQTVGFTRDEINEMFKAATPEQKPVLEKIFGKQIKRIEWDRIKTGSKVMIKDMTFLNTNEPVDIVFLNMPCYIDRTGKFSRSWSGEVYCTFHQNGKFTAIVGKESNHFITEVIEY